METPRSAASVQDEDLLAATDTPPFRIPPALRGRCMRVLRWDEGFTNRVLSAYRQFMGLKIRLEDWDATKLAAPPLIERVWQQHILDVNHYAEACGEHRIHHNPDDGFTAEAFSRRMQSTQLALEGPMFGPVDSEIWSFAPHDNDDNNSSNDEEEGHRNKRRKRNHNNNETAARRTEAITFFVRWSQNNNLQRHNDLYFKIRPDTKMARVFERFNMHWASNDNNDAEESFAFFFGGRLVRPTDTANTISLVSDDMISATRCNAVEDCD